MAPNRPYQKTNESPAILFLLAILCLISPATSLAHGDHDPLGELGENAVRVQDRKGQLTGVLEYKPHPTSRRQQMVFYVEDFLGEKYAEFDASGVIYPAQDRISSQTLFISWEIDHGALLGVIRPLLTEVQNHTAEIEFSDNVSSFQFKFENIRPVRSALDSSAQSTPQQRSSENPVDEKMNFFSIFILVFIIITIAIIIFFLMAPVPEENK